MLNEEKQFFPVPRWKKFQQDLFPARLTVGQIQYTALGSYWVKVEDNPMKMVDDPDMKGKKYEVLVPQPFLKYADNNITSDSIADLRHNNGWLDGEVLNVLINKALKFFATSNSNCYNHIFMNEATFFALQNEG